MNRRFFCDDIPEEGQIARLAAAESTHLVQVLRGRAGDELTLLDGKGMVARGRLLPWDGGQKPKQIDCVVSERRLMPPQRLRCTLFISPPRQKGMAQIVRQTVELGVAEIVPVLAENSVARPDVDAVANWSAAAREACKQSGNPYLPTIHEPLSFAAALRETRAPGFVGYAASGNEANSIEQQEVSAMPASLRQLQGERIDLWIGPEGGFTADEIAAIIAKGIIPMAIGPYTLRVETAVVACLAVCQAVPDRLA